MTRDSLNVVKLMTRHALVGLVERFCQLKMMAHAVMLRDSCRAWKAGEPGIWSPDHVEDWMKRLRIPPYQDALQVRPRNSQCPEGAEGDPHTVCAFPGGWEVECLKCRRKWLEMETVVGAEA